MSSSSSRSPSVRSSAPPVSVSPRYRGRCVDALSARTDATRPASRCAPSGGTWNHRKRIAESHAASRQVPATMRLMETRRVSGKLTGLCASNEQIFYLFFIFLFLFFLSTNLQKAPTPLTMSVIENFI